MKKIADAGLLIGFLDRRDLHHQWAVGIFQKESPPFYTAEPILAEVAAVLGTADDVLQMVEVGDLVLALNLGDEVSPVRALVQKYKDRPDGPRRCLLCPLSGTGFRQRCLYR